MNAHFPGYHVPDAPSLEDAKEAIALLWKPFVGFQFAEPAQARPTALLSMMVAVLRPGLDKAPGIAISAPAAASGKTLLSQVYATVQVGAEVAPLPLPVNFEEQAKTIFAALRSSPPVLLFDNLNARFDSAALCSLITSAMIKGRELGHSRIFEIRSRALVLVNGNGLSMAGDVSSRFLFSELAPTAERPQDRSAQGFEIPDLIGWVKDNRFRIAAAVHTIIRAYIQEVQRLGAIPEHVVTGRVIQGCRFPMVETLRDALLWCGEGDGFLGFHAASEHDGQREERQMVFEIIDAAIISANAKDAREVNAPVTAKRVADAIHVACQTDNVDQIVSGGRSTRLPGAPIPAVTLGRWLTHNLAGGVYGSKRLVKRNIQNQGYFSIEEVK